MIGLNINMPRCCAECPLWYWDDEDGSHTMCGITNDEISYNLDLRNDNCPLIDLNKSDFTWDGSGD